MQVKRVLKN